MSERDMRRLAAGKEGADEDTLTSQTQQLSPLDPPLAVGAVPRARQRRSEPLLPLAGNEDIV